MADKPNAETLERATADLKQATSANDPWIGNELHDADVVLNVHAVDDAIATILNAVVSGDLTITRRRNIDSMEAGE